jgi:hypothetical protein
VPSVGENGGPQIGDHDRGMVRELHPSLNVPNLENSSDETLRLSEHCG